MRKKSLTTRFDRARMSPDLFSGNSGGGGGGRGETKCMLSEEFDDILTITTTTMDAADPADSDIVMVEYPAPQSTIELENMNLLRPPSSTATSKSSLINRFLRNVTQKKIHDATVKKNSTLAAAKIKTDKKRFDNLYVKGMKPKNPDLIDDLNAEIALEMEMAGAGSGGGGGLMGVAKGLQRYCEQQSIGGNLVQNEFGLGVGEIPVDLFCNRRLSIFRDDKEILMKV